MKNTIKTIKKEIANIIAGAIFDTLFDPEYNIYLPDYISEIINEILENKTIDYLHHTFGSNSISIVHNQYTNYDYLSCRSFKISNPPKNISDSGSLTVRISEKDIMESFYDYIENEKIDHFILKKDIDFSETELNRKKLSEVIIDDDEMLFYHDTWAENNSLKYEVFRDTTKKEQVNIILSFLMRNLVNDKNHI